MKIFPARVCPPILVLVMLCLAPLPAMAFDAESDFMFAAGLFKKQRWQYAADAFEAFLKDHPESARANLAQLYLGLSLNSLEKYEPAKVQFETFINENPNSRNLPDARYRLGECNYYLKDYKAAAEQLSTYLKQHPGHNLNEWAALLLGESYNALDDWANADRVLEPLIESNPPLAILADALTASANSRKAQAQPDQAIALLQKVVDLKSVNHTPRALAGIAAIHFEQKDFTKAAEVYDRVLTEFAEDPLATSAALKSGLAKYQAGDYRQALTTLQRVPADSESFAFAALWKAMCRQQLGELDIARKELADAYNAAVETPLAPEILYNRAQIEVLDQKKEVAAQMFLDLADRWPTDSRAADSLFNAAENKLETGDPAMATRILERLQKDYPENAARLETGLLRGRLLLTSGKTDEAIQLLQEVAQANESDERKSLLRNYHLIRALYLGGKYTDALAVFEPLREQYENQKWSTYFGAIALASRSSLELEKYEQAKQLAETFLKLESNPQKVADALFGRAVASTHLKEFDDASADLKRLVTEFPEQTQSWAAALRSAEAAWQQKEYAAAAQFFSLASQRNSEPKLHVPALLGLAWSRYRLNEFELAARDFETVCEKYPESPAWPESSFMQAISLRDAGKADEASMLFLKTYEALEKVTAEADPARPNVEKYLLDSGRNYARLQTAAGKAAAADTMWERLSTRFNNSEQLESLLDEWAYANLQAQQFKRSDEIYRRLLDKFPDGQFAGQARLSLAESELQANRLDFALREFEAIAANEKYRPAEKEAALFHVVEIKAAQREWADVLMHGSSFAKNFGDSPLAPNVQLLYAEGLLDKGETQKAVELLSALRTAVLDGKLKAEPWTERVWVVLAETALTEKRFADIDPIAKELAERNSKSRFLFQMRDVQGRRWKTQPEPDFAKARDYFATVISDEIGRGTETAARCQFLIAETLLLEKSHQDAVKEYYRVYLNYPFDEWRARGLFQAAGCEVLLKRTAAAQKSYNDLINDFPNSELAEKAKAKLQELRAAGG